MPHESAGMVLLAQQFSVDTILKAVSSNPWEWGWDAVVGIGTLALALVTVALAVQTRQMAKGTSEQMEQFERHHQEDNNAHLIFKMPPSLSHRGATISGALVVAHDMTAGEVGSYLTVNVSGQVANVGKGPAQNITLDLSSITLAKTLQTILQLPFLQEGALAQIDTTIMFRSGNKAVQPTMDDLNGSILTITYENKYKALGIIRYRVTTHEQYSLPEMLKLVHSEPPQYITLAERKSLEEADAKRRLKLEQEHDAGYETQ